MKPSNFTNYPWSSVFKKAECETVAQNVMKILERTGNKFRKLSYNEYEKERLKDANYSNGEKKFFDQIIDYCKSEDTAKLFSKSWNN